MNVNLAALLPSPLTVQVVFDQAPDAAPYNRVGKRYSYMTFDPSIQVGDLLVVKAPDGFAVVTCVEPPVPQNPTSRATKWIVQRLDLTEYERCQRIHAEAIELRDTINAAIQRQLAQSGLDLALGQLPEAEANMLRARMDALRKAVPSLTGPSNADAHADAIHGHKGECRTDEKPAPDVFDAKPAPDVFEEVERQKRELRERAQPRRGEGTGRYG